MVQYRSDFNILFREKKFSEDYFNTRWTVVRQKIKDLLINEISLPKYSDKRAVVGVLQNEKADESKMIFLSDSHYSFFCCLAQLFK